MKKGILFITALALGTGLFLTQTSDVFAYRGDTNLKSENCDPERHENMLKAFNSDDYGAWKELMQDKGRVTELVTEENFGRFAEMHKLREEGNFEEANQIREELGLGQQKQMRIQDGNGEMKGFGQMNRHITNY